MGTNLLMFDWETTIKMAVMTIVVEELYGKTPGCPEANS